MCRPQQTTNRRAHYDKGSDIYTHCAPKYGAELSFDGFVSQELLRQKSTGPPSNNREHMQSALGGAECPTPGSRLVDGIGQKRDNTSTQVDQGEPKRGPPQHAGREVHKKKARNRKECGSAILDGRIAPDLSPTRPKGLHISSAFFPLSTEFYFERDPLPDCRSARFAAKGLDVNKNLLPAFGRLDETEPSLIVPGVNAHGILNCVQSQISNLRQKSPWGAVFSCPRLETYTQKDRKRIKLFFRQR